MLLDNVVILFAYCPFIALMIYICYKLLSHFKW